MSFDYKVIGKKIEESRESLLIETKEAADLLSLEVDEYKKIEQGEQFFSKGKERYINGDEIIILSNFLKRDFRYFVTGDYPSSESQIQEMFRQNSSLIKDDRIAIQEFVRLCEYEHYLEEILEYKKQKLLDYKNYKFKTKNYKTQGKLIASLERKRLSLRSSPIDDIFELIRQQGIHIFKRKLQANNISGLYILHPNVGHCILINYSDDLYRQNFSAAHEYCHSIIDSYLEQIVSYKDVRDKYEWRANNFAGNFLVCNDLLIKKFKNLNSYPNYIKAILEMAHYYKVSSMVIIFRLLELGLIDSNLKDKLLTDNDLIIKSKIKIDPEIPEELSPGFKEKINILIQKGLSWYFLELCQKAYRDNQITFHKILEMLSIPFEEGIELLNELKIFIKVSEDG